jgi:hypothetical protein
MWNSWWNENQQGKLKYSGNLPWRHPPNILHSLTWDQTWTTMMGS